MPLNRKYHNIFSFKTLPTRKCVFLHSTFVYSIGKRHLAHYRPIWTSFGSNSVYIKYVCKFYYERQLYRQVLLRARIYGNSVCPSVRLSRPGTDSSPGQIETMDLHRMIAWGVWFLTR